MNEYMTLIKVRGTCRGSQFSLSCGHGLNEQCIGFIEHITTQIAIPIRKTGAADDNFFLINTTEPTFEQSHAPNIRSSLRMYTE